METTLAGKTITLDDNGYLTDLNAWDRDIATAIAAEEGIELTEAHWPVIEYIQTQYRNEVPLTIRKIGKSGIVNIKEFYQLFPEGPLKKSSRIAGIPKPVSCI
jgi:tRNA 2-thiouridine synthesizing protein E